MTEPRPNWFQRLVGSDGASQTALEEQLLESKKAAEQLAAELERERQNVAERDVKLEQLAAQSQAAQQDFEGRLVSVRQSLEQRLEVLEQVERQHPLLVAELAASRNQQQRLTEEKDKLAATLTRQREEAGKLSKSLAAATAQVSRTETELQAARARLQVIETRASTVEHELAATKQALQSAEASARELRAVTQEHTQLREKLGRQEEQLQSTSERLRAASAQRDLAVTAAQDLWRALERALGEAALLALVVGIEPGEVERHPDLADAASALARALQERAACQLLKVEPREDGLVVELRSAELADSAPAAHWLAAFATRFLEEAAGLDLAIESSTAARELLTLRLRTSSRPNAAS